MSTSENVLPDGIRKQRVKELLSLGRLDDAHILLSELCVDGQRDIEIWSLYCTVNGILGRYEDVISACRKILDIDPDYLLALNNLASALAALQRYDEADEQYSNLLRLAPENPAVLNNYGHCLALMGRVEEARSVLCKAVNVQPYYAEARYNLALLLEQSGDLKDALSQCEKAAELKPGLPDIEDRLKRLRELVQVAD